MKKFLTAFLLLGVWLMPQFVKASDESKICYEYLGEDGGGFVSVMTKYLSDGNGTWSKEQRRAYEYFSAKMLEGKESRGVASITCLDLLGVCDRANWKDDKFPTCKAFQDALHKAWDLGKKGISVKTYADNEEGLRQKWKDMEDRHGKYCEAANCPKAKCFVNEKMDTDTNWVDHAVVSCENRVIGTFGPDFKPIKTYKQSSGKNNSGNGLELYCEKRGGIDFIMQKCEEYKRDVTRPGVSNWQLFWTNYNRDYGDCAGLYGYAFAPSSKGGCGKIKK